MNVRWRQMMVLALLLLLAACSRDDDKAQCSTATELNVRQIATNKLNHVADSAFTLMETNTNDLSISSMQAAMRKVRTASAGRRVVTDLVGRIMALDDANCQLEKLRLLEEAVFQRPINLSTPSNRANCHYIIYEAELEVFEGLLRTHHPEEAWRLLLRSIRHLRKIRDGAKMELDKCPTTGDRGKVGRAATRAREDAMEYFRIVNHDYKCAVHVIKDFILPNVKYKVGISTEVERELNAELTEPY